MRWKTSFVSRKVNDDNNDNDGTVTNCRWNNDPIRDASSFNFDFHEC